MNAIQLAILGAALALVAHGPRRVYSRATTSADGAELIVTKVDGSKLSVPKSEGQHAFGKPEVSRDGRYVAWLEMYSNYASDDLPVGVDVLDRSGRIQHFRGDFGGVFGWCFGEQGNTVIYTYSFPHGITPVAFDMRRLSDGKLLQRVSVGGEKPDESDDGLVRNTAPSWALCAWNSAHSQ
jgi:hypothetical protein